MRDMRDEIVRQILEMEKNKTPSQYMNEVAMPGVVQNVDMNDLGISEEDK